ncbi:MAG: hypothetical protein R3C68_15100 [Myxococcota bacterium]
MVPPSKAPPPPPKQKKTPRKAWPLRHRPRREQGDQSGAELLRDKLVQEYPGTAAGADEQESRQDGPRQGNIPLAIDNYERLLFHRRKHERTAEIRAIYADLLLQVGRYEDAATMLEAMHKTADAQERVSIESKLATAYEKTDQAPRRPDYLCRPSK